MSLRALTVALEGLRVELGLGFDAVWLSTEPVGPTLWLSVRMVIEGSNRDARARILDAISRNVGRWFSPSMGTIISQFSQGRGRKRRDGSDPKRTTTIRVSLRDPSLGGPVDDVRSKEPCDGTYVDFQGCRRPCTQYEGCGYLNCLWRSL